MFHKLRVLIVSASRRSRHIPSPYTRTTPYPTPPPSSHSFPSFARLAVNAYSLFVLWTLSINKFTLFHGRHISSSYFSFLLFHIQKNQRLPFHGNHYINRLVGAHLHLNPEPTQTNSTKERDELYHSLRWVAHMQYEWSCHVLTIVPWWTYTHDALSL